MIRTVLAIGLATFLAMPVRAEFIAPAGGNGGWLREIALGRFEVARGATRNERDVIAYQTRRLKLLVALYHDVYDGMCPITGPARGFSQQIDLVTRKALTGQETDRVAGKPLTIQVRQEYVDVFSEGWALAASPAELVLTMGPNVTGLFEELAVASRDVIRANGCGSPGLELFERNLAEIVRGRPSLQRRGLERTEMERRCLDTGMAGLQARLGTPLDAACGCMARQMWEHLPEDWVARVEDRFVREEVLLSAALTPESWEGVRSCLR